MLVDVTRAEFIPKTTVDHVYDGEGYGLLFKAENGNGDVDDDTDMDEAPPEDENKKHEEVKKFEGSTPPGDKKSDSPPSGAVEPKQTDMSGSKGSGSSHNQVKFGSIDFSPSLLESDAQTERKSKVLFPRNLWGGREEEESLPSTPSRHTLEAVLDMRAGQSEMVIGEVLSSAVTEKGNTVQARKWDSPIVENGSIMEVKPAVVCHSKISCASNCSTSSPIHAAQHEVDTLPAVVCHSNILCASNFSTSSPIYADQHEVDTCVGSPLQAQEMITMCDQFKYNPAVHSNSSALNVHMSPKNDVSNLFWDDNDDSANQLSQQKVDVVQGFILQKHEFLQEPGSGGCSPLMTSKKAIGAFDDMVSPGVGAMNLVADQSAGSSLYASTPLVSLAASHTQVSAAAGVVPGYPVAATAGFVPHFAAAVAVTPVTPVILPGVYGS
jgi:hypothetical protein